MTGDLAASNLPADAKSSTDAAINAASRVFNTIDLRGKTREEVIGALGDPKASSNSAYNFAFYPKGTDELVYRFDNGDSGWEFHLHFNGDGKLASVERIGIE